MSDLPMFGAWRGFRWLTSWVVLAYALLTAACSVGHLHWSAELLTHFRVQATLAGALVAAVCALLRMRLGAIAASGLAVWHGLLLAPYLIPARPEAMAGQPTLRMLQLNVHTANRRHADVEKLIADERPDIVALLEVNRRWLSALSGLYDDYPHRIERPREDNFGIALFSRLPLDDLGVSRLQHDGIDMILGHLALGSTPITLAVAHPVPPVGSGYTALRNRQLDQIAQIARSRDGGEFVLLGDLNTSPWSPTYRRLERKAELRNAARGLGVFSTWPTAFPALMIPIDHCLLSSGLIALDFELGPEVGSDHLPVLVEITAVSRSPAS